MSQSLLAAANDTALWVIALIVVSVVALQAVLYIRLAFSEARKIGFPREKCIRALRSGIISAIGPSIAVLIIMVGMISTVGAPISWLRLSVIGSAPTELTAATVGAQAYGVDLGSADYDIMAMASSWWTMTINGIGWLVFVGLFAQRLETIREKVGGGDPGWLAVLSSAAMLGCFAFLNSRSLIAGGGQLVAAVVGGLAMVVFLLISRKLAWFREYTLGLAMLAGMAAAMIFGIQG